jgi:hypothetical protein
MSNEEDVIENEEADEQGQQPDPQDAEYERQARAQGWVPEDEWDEDRAEREGKRKPYKFLTPKEYLAKIDNSAPILRERLRRMEEKLGSAEGKLTDMHQILSDQRRMSADAIKRAVDQALAKAREEKLRAVEEGDKDAYQTAEAKERDIIARQQQQAQQAEPAREEAPAQRQPSAETQRWIGANKWFLTNTALRDAMVHEHNMLIARHPDQDQAELLEPAAVQVRRRYPEFFREEVPQQQRRASVSEPTGYRPPASKTATRVADLPKEDQDAFKRFQKMIEAKGGKYTEAEFLAEYHAM